MVMNGKRERVRGRKLQRIRAAHFQANPLCVMCAAENRVTVATEIDHIVALNNGGKDFDEDPDNAQGLCSSHHKQKTAKDLGHRQKVRIGLDGWPIES